LTRPDGLAGRCPIPRENFPAGAAAMVMTRVGAGGRRILSSNTNRGAIGDDGATNAIKGNIYR